MRLSSLLSVARPPLRTIGPLSDLQYCKSILPGCSVRPRPRACSQLKASYRCKNGHKKALLAPRGQPTCFGIVEPPSSTVVHTRLDYFSRRTRWRDVCVRPRERARCLLPARCLLRCWCSPRPRDHRRCGLPSGAGRKPKTFAYARCRANTPFETSQASAWCARPTRIESARRREERVGGATVDQKLTPEVPVVYLVAFS